MGGTRSVRLLAAASVLVLGASGVVTPAEAAAAPVNDTWQGAVRVKVGETVRQNTSSATTDRLDARLNAGCGAPFTKASVWFSVKPRKTGRFVVDMSRSDYSGGFMVFRGKPSPASLRVCGPQSLVFRGREGVRYYIMAFSDSRVNGGRLVMSLDRVRPPRLRLTVDPDADVTKAGAAWVSGRFRCANADYLEFNVRLTQQVGRLKIVGWAYVSVDPLCDGGWHDYRVRVRSDGGTYGGGKATARVSGLACNAAECTSRTVRGVELRMRRGTT